MALHVDFSRQLARMRFHNRATPLPSGDMVYRLADGSGHVQLSAEEWDAVGRFFKQDTGASARRAYVGIALWPVAFVALVMMLGLPPIAAVLGVIPGLHMIVVMTALVGLPVAVYLRHSAHVQTTVRIIEDELGAMPRVPAPLRDPARVPPWLDFVMMLFLGPHLFIAIVGSIDPGQLEGTPLQGSHIDVVAILGFAVIALRVLWPRLAPMLAAK